MPVRPTLRLGLSAFGRSKWRPLLPVLLGGTAAAVLSTLLQVALWLAFSDAFPGILWRDARMAAAIVLGPDVLAGGGGPIVLGVSTLVHFILSFIYAGAFCALTRALPLLPALVAGVVLGALLFWINMYGFTAWFPWFVASRDWITFAAHLAFGASAVAGCRWARRPRLGEFRD